MSHTISAYNDLVSLVDLELIQSRDFLMNEAIASGIFNRKAHPNYTGDTQRFQEFDMELYAKRKDEGQSAASFQSQMGYSIDATVYRYAFNIDLSYEYRSYEKHDTTSSLIRGALQAQENKLDLDLQQLISQATATSYTDNGGNTITTTVGDGLALASTAHTLLGTSDTYRNRLANNPQFSSGGLELMEQMWNENCLNHFGQKAYKKPTHIWSTDDPVVVNAIRKELASMAPVDAPNGNVLNPNKGKYQHVVFSKIAIDPTDGSPDTTKRNYWGLVAAGMDGWQAFFAVNEPAHRMPEADASNTYDNKRDLYSIPMRIGYSYAVLSGRYFTISTGDGTA